LAFFSFVFAGRPKNNDKQAEFLASPGVEQGFDENDKDSKDFRKF
jgi:hypothetical protein